MIKYGTNSAFKTLKLKTRTDTRGVALYSTDVTTLNVSDEKSTKKL